MLQTMRHEGCNHFRHPRIYQNRLRWSLSKMATSLRTSLLSGCPALSSKNTWSSLLLAISMQAVEHYQACDHAGCSAQCHLHSLHALRFIGDTHKELTTTLYRITSQSKSHMAWRKGVIIVTSLSPSMPKRSSLSSQRLRSSGASIGTFVAAW